MSSPRCTCGAGGGRGVEVDDILRDGDVCAGMSTRGTVAFLDKLPHFSILEIKELPALIDDVQFFRPRGD